MDRPLDDRIPTTAVRIFDALALLILMITSTEIAKDHPDAQDRLLHETV